ncbi:YggT family protein [Methylobacter sp. Wu8]|uniref:YggT family protein n=1 Tax=Methylobacter tundripaludum TaxID=173365 RepID=A0A2S6H837_9GAMM|nr:YggT family protein [Methylobacter tundripaludum]MCF7964936.1 YggT family protein [Methylobacter tundripaludum]MCK9637579.1 YggT family protein [Methylobacter tundripaludum]PPK73637.1 YggT family protein [Methylobacter tundripaludum]
MDSSYMTDPAIFIIDSLLSLYILAVLLRFLLQWCGADFYNPISQFLVKATHPPLKLLRRFVPSIGKIDTSSLVLVMGLQMLADFSILLLKGVAISIGALTILSLTQLVSLLINIFIYAVFARAILSWMNPGTFSAASSVLYSLTEPVLNLCRKFIPDLGGIDLSPLAALMLLQLAKMVILPPLHQLASLIG